MESTLLTRADRLPGVRGDAEDDEGDREPISGSAISSPIETTRALDDAEADEAVGALAQGRSQSCGGGCSLRALVVLDVDDLPIRELEDVHPVVTPAFLVRPGDGDDDAVATLLDRIDPSVVVAVPAAPVDRRRESLTGLGGAVSGGRRSPEPGQAASTTPLHLWVDQRDQRLDLAARERLVGSTDRLDIHSSTVPLSGDGSKTPAPTASRR
jgi:hypothetical protein